MTGHQPQSRPTRRNWASFYSLLILQTQNAFNDKAAQFLLIPLGGLLASTSSIPAANGLEYILGALIVLPFIMFAPIAGWLSDRYSKTSVIRGAIFLQFAVFICILSAIYYQKFVAGHFWVFHTFCRVGYSQPAKRGIVKELVGHGRLGFASGILEMSVVLAVCAGQILSSKWFDINLVELESTTPRSRFQWLGRCAYSITGHYSGGHSYHHAFLWC